MIRDLLQTFIKPSKHPTAQMVSNAMIATGVCLGIIYGIVGNIFYSTLSIGFYAPKIFVVYVVCFFVFFFALFRFLGIPTEKEP